MKNRCVRICCVILTVFVLLSGLGIENIHKELPFSLLVTQEQQALMLPQSSITFNTQLCVMESMSMEENSEEEAFFNQISYRKLSHHVDYTRKFILLPRLEELVYLCSNEMFFLEYSEEEHILNYIHKLDGKKRI